MARSWLLLLFAACRVNFDRLPAPADADVTSPCVTAVTTRSTLGCALRGADGSVWCWGNNQYGSLGNGEVTNSSTPVRAGSLVDVAQIDVSASDGYAVGRDGTVYGWGGDFRSQLGNVGMTNRAIPAPITGLPPVDEIRAGEAHACVRSGGDVYCWGWNGDGQVGDGTIAERETPVLVLGGAISLAAGGRTTCAIKTDRSVWCWGANAFGSVGIGNNASPQPTPVQIPAFTAEQVVVGGAFACARRGDGTIWCWGHNPVGQLGDGGTGDRNTPVMVASLANATALHSPVGGRRVCAQLGDGSNWCWGEARYGTRSPTAILLGPTLPTRLFDGAAQLATASTHTCGVMQDGTAACSGINESGQLGDGTQTSRVDMAPVLLACP